MRLLLHIFLALNVAVGCTSTGHRETDSSPPADHRDPPDASIADTDDTDTAVSGTDTGHADAGDTEAGDTETADASVAEAVVFQIDAMLASDIVYEAPGTVGIVTWSVTGTTVDRAEIRFGLTTEYGMTAPVDLAAPAYRTLLLGMKSSRVYHFQIVVEGGGRVFGSADQSIETGPASNLVTL